METVDDSEEEEITEDMFYLQYQRLQERLQMTLNPSLNTELIPKLITTKECERP